MRPPWVPLLSGCLCATGGLGDILGSREVVDGPLLFVCLAQLCYFSCTVWDCQPCDPVGEKLMRWFREQGSSLGNRRTCKWLLHRSRSLALALPGQCSEHVKNSGGTYRVAESQTSTQKPCAGVGIEPLGSDTCLLPVVSLSLIPSSGSWLQPPDN